MKRLKIKDQIFVKELVNPKDPKDRGKATRAAIIAYGQTPKAAAVTASRKLNNANIQTSIAAQLEKSGVSREFLDEGLQKIITSGLNNYKKTRPSDALNAIHIANKLLDRYPATKVLNANLDLTRDLEGQETTDLVKLLKEVQEQNKALLDRLESNPL